MFPDTCTFSRVLNRRVSSKTIVRVRSCGNAATQQSGHRPRVSREVRRDGCFLRRRRKPRPQNSYRLLSGARGGIVSDVFHTGFHTNCFLTNQLLMAPVFQEYIAHSGSCRKVPNGWCSVTRACSCADWDPCGSAPARHRTCTAPTVLQPLIRLPTTGSFSIGGPGLVRPSSAFVESSLLVFLLCLKSRAYQTDV